MPIWLKVGSWSWADLLSYSFGCQRKSDVGSEETMHVMLSDEELVRESKRIALFTAIENRSIEDLDHVVSTVKSGANECYDNENVGYTALHKVITVAEDWEQSADAVKLLLENGFDPNTPTDDKFKRTPLLLVVDNDKISSRSTAILKLLLEHDWINIDAVDSFENSALRLAAEKGHLMAVEMLISYNADVNRIDNFDNTPLSYAAKNNHLKVAHLLLQNGADSTHQNKKLETPLHIAVCSKDPKMVTLLLNCGNKEVIRKKNKNEETPLEAARMKERDPIMDSIIEMLTEPKKIPKSHLGREACKAGVEAVADGDHVQNMGRFRSFMRLLSQDTDGQPHYTYNHYDITLNESVAAISGNVNIESPYPVPGLPCCDFQDATGQVNVQPVPAESLVDKSSASSSDQPKNPLGQCQNDNQVQGKATTSLFNVDIKYSSGTTVIGENSSVTISPTREELPGAFGSTVPNVDQGTGGDLKTDSATKPDGQVTSVPKIARVSLNK